MSLTSVQWSQVEALFARAMGLSGEAEGASLDGLSLDPEVRAEFEALVAAADGTGDFLSRPAAVISTEGASDALAEGARLGPWRVLRRVGRGGMGEVYEALRADGQFDQRAAIKVMWQESAPLLKRFQIERQILARLDHPGIARLLDGGVTPSGQPYAVMEFVDGQTLTEWCRAHRSSFAERLELFLQVCAAVTDAHRNLIVHRDLKPANILVDASGRVRLLDFGIAKLLDSTGALDAETSSAFTPDYAAPEQLTGGPITTATDVHALGLLLFELLTDQRARSIRGTRPPPSRVAGAPPLPLQQRTDLDAIVERCLRTEPARRYQSVDALGLDVEATLRGAPVGARGNGTLYLVGHFVRRHALATAMVGAIGLSLTAGITLALWQARRADQSARQARAEALRTTKVKNLLLDIFNANSKQQADPLRAQQATARELLDRGAERLLADATLDPDVAVEMLKTLQELFLDLGLDERSVELNRRRVELARRAFGPNDERVAMALVELGGALYATPQPDEANGPLEEATRILDANKDQTSLTRAELHRMLAERWRSRDLALSRQHASAALEIYQRYHPDSVERIEAMRMAALTEQFAHHPAVAAELLDASIALHRRLGAPEFELVRPLVELAEQHVALSRFAEADAEFVAAIEITLRLNGPAHVDTLEAQTRYGSFLRTVGWLRKSEALLRQVEKTAAGALGNDESFHLPTLRFELAKTLASVGKIEEAAATLQDALAIRVKTRPQTRQHGNMLQETALLSLTLGRYEQAEAAATQSEEIFKKIGDQSLSPRITRATEALARNQPAKTLNLLDTLKLEGTDFALLRSFQVDAVRGRALLALQRPDEAQKLIAASLQRIPSAQAPFLEGLRADLLMNLGLAWVRSGHTAESLAPLRDALAWRATNLDPGSPLVAEALIALAEGQLAAHERAKARELLDRASRIQGAHRELGEHLRAPLRRMELELAGREG